MRDIVDDRVNGRWYYAYRQHSNLVPDSNYSNLYIASNVSDQSCRYKTEMEKKLQSCWDLDSQYIELVHVILERDSLPTAPPEADLH